MSLKEIGPFVHAKGPIFKAFLLRCLSIILRYNDISPVAEAYKLVIHLLYFSAIFSMMSTTGHASASTNICIFYPASSNKRNYLSRYLNMFIWPSHS